MGITPPPSRVGRTVESREEERGRERERRRAGVPFVLVAVAPLRALPPGPRMFQTSTQLPQWVAAAVCCLR
jgi:hypothetical protein